MTLITRAARGSVSRLLCLSGCLFVNIIRKMGKVRHSFFALQRVEKRHSVLMNLSYLFFFEEKVEEMSLLKVEWFIQNKLSF